MRMNLYYVVRPYKGGNDSIGRDAECDCVAGPFYSFSSAWDAKRDMIFSDNYEVVKQPIGVQ